MRSITIVGRIMPVIALCVYTPAMAQTIRNYDVNFTSNNIVADGIVSPGEWDGAAPATGEWRVLRQPFSDVDEYNNRFSMLYDANNLYILYESDYDFGYLSNLGGTRPAINFSEENINIYIDPNRDGDFNTDENGDRLLPGVASNVGVDGYQLAFNQYVGTSVSTGADRDGIGFFTEAHVNLPFGDQGNWNQGGSAVEGPALDGSNIVVGQTNSNSQDVPAFTAPNAYGIIEVVIPFADLDADEMISDGPGGMIPTGLNATDGGTRIGPVPGEVWGFNSALITGDRSRNWLPIWNWQNSNSFPNWPHGTITFQEVPEPGTMVLVLLTSLAVLAQRRCE